MNATPDHEPPRPIMGHARSYPTGGTIRIEDMKVKDVAPETITDTWSDSVPGIDGKSGSATFSPDRQHRYLLTRRWPHPVRPPQDDAPFVAFIGLNPSTADARDDDPTMRRCRAFASVWGFDRFTMLNLFAYRATDPNVMKSHADPIGSLNDRFLVETVRNAAVVIAAWGVHGVHLDRANQVCKLLRAEGLADRLKCLGLTQHGHPRHPLYVKGDTQPVDFVPLCY